MCIPGYERYMCMPTYEREKYAYDTHQRERERERERERWGKCVNVCVRESAQLVKLSVENRRSC